MTSPRKRKIRAGSLRTTEGLLAAASALFAERGYRDTTIADICERTGANLAAVNYHFGSKEQLYVEAWRHAFVASVSKVPPDGGVPRDAPPEERLRGRVRALLRRIADPENLEFAIVHRELTQPTGLLDEVMRRVLRPLHDALEALIRELLGGRVSPTAVQFSVISIISQCMNPVVFSSTRPDVVPRRARLPRIDDLEAFADHVVRFSLAGLRAVQPSAETTRSRPCTRPKAGGGRA